MSYRYYQSKQLYRAGDPAARGAYQSYVLYRTGDLARWRPDGNIEFLGRLDHQVKIRGFRVELGEIQQQLLTHPLVKEAVVIVRETGSADKDICAYIVTPNAGLNTDEIKNHLGQVLPEYMIPSFFVVLDHIPLTPGGKVDRKALPLPGTGLERPITAPRDAVEKQLAGIWQEVLSLESPVSIDIDTGFFALGGHSLKAVILASRIHKAFHVKITPGEFFKISTIRALGQVIRKAEKTAFREIEKVEEKEYYPLSHHQARVYVLHQMEPQSPAYNMPTRLILEGLPGVDEISIKNMLTTLVERHESLRTGITVIHDEPRQFIADTLELPLHVIDLSSLGTASVKRSEEIYTGLALTPFDMETLPLFKAVFVKLPANRSELMLNLHHIITDGWSMAILQKEFYALLGHAASGKALEIPPQAVRYRDFVNWHIRQLQEPSPEEESPAAKFWKNKLAGGIPSLQLPGETDGETNRPDGAALQIIIDQELRTGLRNLAAENQTSLFTVMFSLYVMMLSRISGQHEIGCSVIAAGREHTSFQDIVGLFVNSLLFKIRLEECQPFVEFLQQVSADVMEAFQYQAYPMELAFEQLNIKYPEINVSFNMLNMQDITGLQSLSPVEAEYLDHWQDVKFDLEPYITEYENSINTVWVYRRCLFDPSAVRYMADLYLELARYFTANPGQSMETQKEEKKKFRFLRDN